MRLVPLAAVLTFVALLHCGDDDGTLIECTLGPTGKTCDCTPGSVTTGFCGPEVLGVPSVCCAQDGWPASGKHCNCDLVVCVSTATLCKCTRASQKLTDPAGEEVAECPAVTSDTTRCCIDKAGNCGCYPKAADQCGEGATDVDKCTYFKAQLPCATGEHAVTTCEH